MNDDQILARGGNEDDIKKSAELNGADLTKEDVLQDPFKAQREVGFFLRIHRHLPDRHCGDAFPFGKCNYRPDGEPINAMNERVDELKKDPAFLVKEKEVEEAVRIKWAE